jgi:hypothetical protein
MNVENILSTNIVFLFVISDFLEIRKLGRILQPVSARQHTHTHTSGTTTCPTHAIKYTNRLYNTIFFSLALRPPWALASVFQFHDHFQTVGHLGRVISLSQGLYLNIGQHKHTINTYTKHPCLAWDSNPRSRLPSERRQFMP